ncbi:DUF362 domain-containing protein [Candidatus Bathyarchaeota archaeon]|nr:DUF362 domain-containing protein [Candidatus Bathyarchaeota archaeon]
MSTVALVKIYQNDFDQAIKMALNMIEDSLPSKAENIVIKPNMCYYWDYTTGQTTDPRFVKAIINIIREKFGNDIDIALVESDASAMRCKYAFKMLGYEKLSKETGVRLVNLSEDEKDYVNVTAGKLLFHISVPKTITKSDFRINVTKIKYSLDKIGITCALKNIFGCNPYPRKYLYHPILDETIVAMNKAMKFHLVIVDGNIVSGVKPRKLGLVMAGKDPVSVDVVAARIAGVRKPIRYISLAEKEGLGNKSFICKGVSLDYFEKGYPRKQIMNKALTMLYNLAVDMHLETKLGLE